MTKIECSKCGVSFPPHWLKDDTCNGCRNPESIVTAVTQWAGWKYARSGHAYYEWETDLGIIRASLDDSTKVLFSLDKIKFDLVDADMAFKSIGWIGSRKTEGLRY